MKTLQLINFVLFTYFAINTYTGNYTPPIWFMSFTFGLVALNNILDYVFKRY